ncbi:MAG: ABC transporter ATP-binding protein [Deltaproteobacteria bacterium]
MISVQNISKVYKVNGQPFIAAEDLSLTIDKGEMVAIVGHSGSGKTTLLSMIGGLTKPDRGTVKIADTDLWALSDNHRSEFRNRTINFIYQFASLIPTLNALENVLLPSAFGPGRNISYDKARDLLQRVGLADKEKFYPSQLSGGQQRRVAIARAFINDPQVLLADEPTGDLDETTEKEIINLFQAMNKERGITFVIVTHEQSIASVAHRRLSMKDGRLIT